MLQSTYLTGNSTEESAVLKGLVSHDYSNTP